MNRNQESHYSHIPNISKSRSTFDRSHSHATSFSFGQVIPILRQEILPGDTFSLRTSKIARLQTLLTPVYANMYLDTYFFFVPNRLVWTHWKEFMGENTASAWAPTVEYHVPTITPPLGGFDYHSIAAYMGYPPKRSWNSTGAPIVLPLRALALICNDFFRDQNLQDPLNIPVGDGSIVGKNGDGLDAVARGGTPFIASKFHDIFTSCLPQPQKGPAVTAPITGSLPVYSGMPHNEYLFQDGQPQHEPFDPNFIMPTVMTHFTSSGGRVYNDLGFSSTESAAGSANFKAYQDYTDISQHQFGNWSQKFISNMWVSNPSPSGSLESFGIDIQALRLAVVTQQYYEALARSGSRYEEQILTFFGVSNPDSRIQHPEYLGGNRVQINVREITNTAQGEQDFLGDVGAQSVTADSHGDFSKSFTEHGWLIGVCVARYDHTYADGIDRSLMRKDKFDYYNPLFASIGEQPIYKYEIFADSDTMEKKYIFGYNEAWIHYRTAYNRVSGSLYPKANSNLGHWSIADNYAQAPTLSESWIREDKTNVDRALAVTSTLENQIFADFYFDIKHTRVMPMYSVPGQLGSF